MEQFSEEKESKERQDIVNQAVFEMKPPCNLVLSMFYWQGKSMREIADKMNYQSEQVAKNAKHKCMKILKSILQKRFKQQEITIRVKN